jgi:hypothetical protein
MQKFDINQNVTALTYAPMFPKEIHYPRTIYLDYIPIYVYGVQLWRKFERRTL